MRIAVARIAETAEIAESAIAGTMQVDGPSETELIQAAMAGDAEAFQDVIRPHLPMLLAYSRAICGDHHAAEDVVQETAVVAFRNLTKLFPEADFATWLRAIARRQALAARRKLDRLCVGIVEETIEKVYEDSSPAAASPRRDALKDCVENLGERMGQVIRGHYFRGAKLTELAERMETTVGAIKQLLFRARGRLRRCIAERLRLEQHP